MIDLANDLGVGRTFGTPQHGVWLQGSTPTNNCFQQMPAARSVDFGARVSRHQQVLSKNACSRHLRFRATDLTFEGLQVRRVLRRSTGP